MQKFSVLVVCIAACGHASSSPGMGTAQRAPSVGLPAKGVDPFLVSAAGVGRFAGIRYVDDEQALAALQAAVRDVPTLSVETAVMEIDDHETEEGFFSVTQSGREILQYIRPGFRGHTEPSANRRLEAHIVDPVFVTTDGVRVGDKVLSLSEKYRDLLCRVRSYQGDLLGMLTCTSALAPGLLFVIDAEGYRGRVTNKAVAVKPASIAAHPILKIVQ